MHMAYYCSLQKQVFILHHFNGGRCTYGKTSANYTVSASVNIVLSKIMTKTEQGATNNFVKENRRMWVLDDLNDNVMGRITAITKARKVGA
jgi:hypothetical protein